VEDLLAKGVETHLCSQIDSYALEKAKTIGAHTYSANFFRSRLDPTVPRQLERITRAVGPSILHLHGTRAGFFSNWMVRSGGWPTTIYTVRGYHFLHKNFLLRYLGAIAEKWSNRCVDATVFVCQYDQEVAKKYRLLPSGKNGTVIYNGIRPNRFPQPVRTIPKSIVFVGRLVHQKNPYLLIDIMRELKDEGYVVKIIGGGELEHEVRKRIQSLDLAGHVTMTGPLAHGEVLNQLKSSDVFLLPSRWEGLPVAPLEAMQMGIPVVLSDVCGNNELVEHRFNGLLVKGQSPKAYANALRLICADRDFRNYLIANGRETVRRTFIQERVTDQYLDLYEGCLQMVFRRRRGQ
jgi:glycosyltransferase involved in cell wall biosynthesis